jgi:hypothetical protein
MKTLSRIAVGLCFAGFVLSAIACGGSAEIAPSNSDDELRTTETTTDAQLQAMIATAPKPLTNAAGEKILRAAMSPTLTTARLKMVNEFAGAPQGDGDAYDNLTNNVQVVYGTAPRDLASTPAGFGEQSFATTIKIDDHMANEVSFKVVGTARHDYALEFTISDHRVKIAKIPAGSSAEDTAKLVAKAIAHDKDAIMENIFEEKGIGDNQGNYGGLDDFECSADGDTVKLMEEING